MDNLIPHRAKTSRGMNLGASSSSSQKCAVPWGELPYDDDKEDMKTAAVAWLSFGKDDYTVHSGEDSEDQGKAPFRDASMPLCQDHLWEDYSQKQKRQSQSLSKSNSSSSTASSPWRQSAQVNTIPEEEDMSPLEKGAPWVSNRRYLKKGFHAARQLYPINNFWARPEACYAALLRMVERVGMEPPEDDEPETSFWTESFGTSTSSSPNTATPPTALSSIQEQDEGGEENIDECGSNNMLVAPPPTLASPGQQYHLNDQDYVNFLEINDILSTMEQVIVEATVDEDEVVGTELTPSEENSITSQDDTQTVEVMKNSEVDLIDFSELPDSEVISNVREQAAEQPSLMDDDQEEKQVVGIVDAIKEDEKSSVYAMQEREISIAMEEKQVQQDIGYIKQEQEVNIMYDGQRIGMKQHYPPQFAPFKEPVEIVVKLSDVVHGSLRPKLKLSDLIEQPSTPVKPSAPSHPPRPRVTLADLM
ncbi:hypothetical protein MBANPS3_004754 [Mucor bainieri]